MYEDSFMLSSRQNETNASQLYIYKLHMHCSIGLTMGLKRVGSLTSRRVYNKLRKYDDKVNYTGFSHGEITPRCYWDWFHQHRVWIQHRGQRPATDRGWHMHNAGRKSIKKTVPARIITELCTNHSSIIIYKSHGWVPAPDYSAKSKNHR